MVANERTGRRTSRHILTSNCRFEAYDGRYAPVAERDELRRRMNHQYGGFDDYRAHTGVRSIRSCRSRASSS